MLIFFCSAYASTYNMQETMQASHVLEVLYIYNMQVTKNLRTNRKECIADD